jgi:hypothetical protein
MSPQLYKDKDGRLVQIDHEDETAVYFYPQGGGMMHSCTKEHFYSTFTPIDRPELRRGLVTADFLQGEDGREVRLQCWSDGMAWNGWGMPYFPRDSVDKLIKLLDADPHIPKIRWADNGEDVIYHDGEEDADGNSVPTVMSPHVMPDGTWAWPIGAGSWCYDSVMFPEGCTPEVLEKEWGHAGRGGEYPALGRSAWRGAVIIEDTILGYWAWVSHQLLEEMA